jgi:beta-carotene hydroxylase
MSSPHHAEGLPALEELGHDLLHTSPGRRAFALAMPFLCAALFAGFYGAGLWPLAVLAIGPLSFFTYGSTSHDLVHRNLGLPHFWNEVLLSATELLALRSGHAYRISHLHHHAAFPNDDDLEGLPARRSALGALAAGPTYLLRLWGWSWRRGHPVERRWIAGETLAVAGYLVTAIAVVRTHPGPLLYAGLVFFASWFFPLGLVKVQHDARGHGPLFQTRAFRGRVIPALLLQHTFHLEHHLYPAVPAQNWRELSRRLDPYLDKAGVHPIRIP